MDKETNTSRDYTTKLKERFAPFTDLPIIFISAKEKTRIFKVIETAPEVFENRSRKIPTSKLNDVMLKAVENYHAPVVRGHSIKIKFVSQLPTPVPSLHFSVITPMILKHLIEITWKIRCERVFL